MILSCRTLSCRPSPSCPSSPSCCPSCHRLANFLERVGVLLPFLLLFSAGAGTCSCDRKASHLANPVLEGSGVGLSFPFFFPSLIISLNNGYRFSHKIIIIEKNNRRDLTRILFSVLVMLWFASLCSPPRCREERRGRWSHWAEREIRPVRRRSSCARVTKERGHRHRATS